MHPVWILVSSVHNPFALSQYVDVSMYQKVYLAFCFTSDYLVRSKNLRSETTVANRCETNSSRGFSPYVSPLSATELAAFNCSQSVVTALTQSFFAMRIWKCETCDKLSVSFS